MDEKRDANLITSGWHLEMTGPSKFIIEPKKVGTFTLETPEDQVEKRSFSPRQESLILIWLQGLIACCIALQPLYCLSFWIDYPLATLFY